MRTILGIDEAGRGCVLGPMVVVGYQVEESRLAELVRLGARDSKALSPSRREGMERDLYDLAHRVEIREFPPSVLDGGNLNDLGFQATLEMISATSPHQVQLDAPVQGAFCVAYALRLATALGPLAPPQITAENQAEDRYPAVGAASILAKLRRDAHIANLRLLHGDIGSGYPSDPRTRAFLADCLSQGTPLPSCVRTRWKTLQNIAGTHRQGELF